MCKRVSPDLDVVERRGGHARVSVSVEVQLLRVCEEHTRVPLGLSQFVVGNVLIKQHLSVYENLDIVLVALGVIETVVEHEHHSYERGEIVGAHIGRSGREVVTRPREFFVFSGTDTDCTW